MSGTLRLLPNFLTASRLVFAAGFLLLLALAREGAMTAPTIAPAAQRQLFWAFVLFVIGGLTDVIDGPLARRLQVTSRFGRTFDPLVDKVFIIGGFVLLVCYGPERTALAWWMLAVVVARELLVTVVRHLSEAQGRQFAATWAGKLKMFLQSFAIGTVIIYLAYCQGQTWALWVRNLAVWTAVVVTALSALVYLPRMKHLLRKNRGTN